MTQVFKLLIDGLDDPNIRENFRRIEAYLRSDVFRKLQARFFEYTFTDTNVLHYPKTVTFAHGLNFIPKDLIPLSVKNGAAITWNYDLFDTSTISFTSDKPTTVRALVGSYGEI